MSTIEQIETVLRDAFSPVRLEVIDDSHRHAGHVGARPQGETHFNVTIVAAAFDGLSRVDRHRLVYTALDSQLKGGVHALALSVSAPSED